MKEGYIYKVIYRFKLINAFSHIDLPWSEKISFYVPIKFNVTFIGRAKCIFNFLVMMGFYNTFLASLKFAGQR